MDETDGERTREEATDVASDPPGESDETPDAAESVAAPDALTGWSLATFHAALFVALPVTLFHAAGVLADLLAGLGTLVGIVLYLLLWGVTWVTNRRFLAASGLAGTTRTAVAGLKWGAVTGLLFGYGLVVVVGIRLGNLPLAGVLLVAGTLVGPLVGGLVGSAFALFDRFLVRLARRLAPAAE